MALKQWFRRALHLGPDYDDSNRATAVVRQTYDLLRKMPRPERGLTMQSNDWFEGTLYPDTHIPDKTEEPEL